ncbi:MAG: MFS transporter [Actinomycetota bacterium]
MAKVAGMTPQLVIRSYLVISGLFTLSASIIWGVNTLFLLNAGLDIFEVFIANAAWTAGMVVFEIPTGLLADTRGRRASFLLSVSVLGVGTLAYVGIAAIEGGVILFAIVSVVLGLGYTFYSGAVEAWVVDALHATKYRGDLDRVFARAGVISGAAMLTGTIGGGLLGTLDLSWPYVTRAVLLFGAFAVAWGTMKDLGFTPRTMQTNAIAREMRGVARASVKFGWRQPSVRLIMLASFVQFGVFAWAFYAWQPYLLELLGRNLIWVAGLFASLIALMQIVGSSIVGKIAKPGGRRTSIMLAAAVGIAVAFAGMGLTDNFWLAGGLFLAATLVASVAGPVKQAYLHQKIPSAQRATVVSFDSLFGSLGSVFTQTGLGYLSRARSIAIAFVVSGVYATVAIPITSGIRRLRERADRIAGRGVEDGGPVKKVPRAKKAPRKAVKTASAARKRGAKSRV